MINTWHDVGEEYCREREEIHVIIFSSVAIPHPLEIEN